MADFYQSYNVLAPNEGGYRNVQWDRGGETYRGISRVYHPEASIWSYIDNYKAQYGTISEGHIFPQLESQVQQFVYNTYWLSVLGDQINNQQVANMVLDFCYQSSHGPQQINEALGTGSSNEINEDTITAMNADPPGAFEKIKQARLNYYQNLNNEGYISNNDITGVLARVERILGPAGTAAAGLGILIATFFLHF